MTQSALTSRQRAVPTRRFLQLVTIFAFTLVVWAMLAPHASAHAILERSVPEQGDRLKTSPAYLELTFNERLDNSAPKLLVLDERSKTVASGKPERVLQGKGLKLALPSLGEGHYTVSYDVISADGHPVSGAYVFTIGNPPPLPDASKLDPHAQIGHSEHNHGGTQQLTTSLFLFYVSRVLYYLGLLVLSGLLLWSLRRSAPAGEREASDKAIGLAGKFLLLVVLAYVVFQLAHLTEGEPLSDWWRILKDTTVGRLMAAQLLLALAAPLLRTIGLYGRMFWVAAILFIEAWNGHAAAFSPISYTVGLDFVHLVAASVWAGGLFLLAAIWRSERPEAGRFALVFSKWALLAFFLLALTGTLSTLAYLPSLSYLFFTAWGTWLLIKIGLSILVIPTAFLIRRRLSRGDLPQASLLRVDLGLMAAIVFSIAILTYQNPLPPNQPLSYHEMGTDMHSTLRISPNVPGDNKFTLKIWLPEKSGAPKSVLLELRPLSKSDIGFIEIPLKAYQDDELDDFPEYTKLTYEAQGPFLAFAGKWEAEIRVTDSKDNEIIRKTTFRIY